MQHAVISLEERISLVTQKNVSIFVLAMGEILRCS